MDHLFSALANPARRTMIERLVRGPASVSELARPLKMSMPSVVQHLQQLERCGLVASRKSGRVRTFRIRPGSLDAAQAWLERQRAVWEARFDRLDSFLTESEAENDNQGPRS